MKSSLQKNMKSVKNENEKMYVRSSPVFVFFPIFERALPTTSRFEVGLSEV